MKLKDIIGSMASKFAAFALALTCAGNVWGATVQVATQADLTTAIANASAGDTVQITAAGTYTLPAVPRNITIEGTVEDVLFSHTGSGNVCSIPNGATFTNVSFTFGNNDYHGFQHAGKIEMEGCNLTGRLTSYGDMEFSNCVFTHGSDYHMWVYGPGTIRYTGCTFTNTSKGKFINLYQEDKTAIHYAYFTDCKFINKGSESKAALNIKATSEQNPLTYYVVVEGCTYDGSFPTAGTTATGSDGNLIVLNPLVQVDDIKEGVDSVIEVTLDGRRIYPEPDAVTTVEVTGTADENAEGTSANYTFVPTTTKGEEVTQGEVQTVAVSVAAGDAADTTLAKFNMAEVLAAAIGNAGEDASDVRSVELLVKSTPTATANAVSYEVHPEAVVTVSKTGEAATSSTVELSNSDLAANATFTFDLDVLSLNLAAGDKVKVTHSWDAYTDAAGNSVAAGSETTLAAVLEGKKVRITTTHFSTWTLEGIEIKNDTVAVVFAADGTLTQYATLAEALTTAATAGVAPTVEVLVDEIDCAGWVPVTIGEKSKLVTLNGNGVVLKNLSAPLFNKTGSGCKGVVVKNVVVSNAAISMPGYASAFLPYADSTETCYFENCHIVDSTITCTAEIAGALSSGQAAGFVAWGGGYDNPTDGPVFCTITIKGCSVKNSTITGVNSTGGLLGHAGANPWTYAEISDTEISGNTIVCTDDSNKKAGSVLGTVGPAGQVSNGRKGGIVIGGNSKVVNNTVKSNGETVDRIFGRIGSNGGAVAVTGGTYDGTANYANDTYDWTNGKITISGGSFKTAPSADALADGYAVTGTPNADGYYTLEEAPKGTITVGYVDASRGVWGEADSNAKESFSVKVYSGETLLGTTTLNNIGGIIDGSVNVTWSALLPSVSDEYWTTVWEEDGLAWNKAPTKVELWVDGVKVAENVAQLNGPDGINPVKWWQVTGVSQPPISVVHNDVVVDKCGTIADALAVAQSGDVVSVSAGEFELKSTAVIPAGVALKGAGKDATTFTISTTNGDGVKITNPNVTISDATINGSAITSSGYNSPINVEADGVVIDSVVMTGGGKSTWNSSILVEKLTSEQTFTVKNSTISGSFRGVLRESCSANIVIKNCDIDAVYPFNIDGGNGGTVTVADSALHGWTSYGGVDSVTFTNCEFSKANSGYDSVAAYVDTTFDGCTFDSNFEIKPQTTGFTFELEDCTKNGVALTWENMPANFGDANVWNKCTCLVDHERVAFVAQIGDTVYNSLDKAIAAAVAAVPADGTETTIKMIADEVLSGTVTIPAEKNIVLDLNGKTVSGAISAAPVICNNGTLIITDSGNAGTIANTLVDSTTSVKLSGAVNNYGTLTLNGGSYSTSVGGSYVIYTGEDATTTVNNCTVRGGAMKGVFQTAGGTLVVNDADVDVSCDYYVFDLRAWATVTVAGGTFNCAKDYYQQMINLALKEGGENTLNITGGTFTFSSTALKGGNQPDLVVFNGPVAEGATAAVNIYGGAFSYGSPYFAWLNGGPTLTDSSVSISGGIFNVSPVWNTQSASLIAADYEVVSNTDAATKDDYPYTVVSDYEAQIVRGGAVEQKGTLAEMIAAATSGDTIQLLKDIVVTAQIVIPKSLTLDGNGHTIATTADWAVNVNNVDDGEVTIKKLTITAGSGTERFVNVQESANLKLNLAGCTMTGCTYYAVNVRGSNSNIALNITDCNISGWCALNIWGAGGTVNVSGGTLGGVNSYSYAPGHNGNDFGVIVLNASTAPYEVTIAGTTLSAASVADSQNRKNREDIVLFNSNAANYTVRLDGCKIERSDDPSLQGLFKEEDGTSNNLLYANNTVDKTTSTTAVLPAGYAYMPADENGWMLVAEAVASVTTGGTGAGTTYYATLAAALDAAQDGDTVTLLKDVTVSEEIDIADGRSITLDLNGKNVALNNGNIGILHGGLAVAGTGTIGGASKGYKSIYLKGSTNPADANYSTLSIGENVTVTSENGYAVMVSANGSSAYGVVIDVNGTVQGHYGALYTNGTIQQHDGENVTKVNVNSTAKISSPEVDVAAVYAAGYAEWMFADGCEVSGGTAVFAKGGNIVVNGGKFTANGAASEFVHGNNGCEITGEAFVIESAYGYAPVSVEVKGGTFNSANANAVGSYAYGDGYAPVDGFISGGDFSSAVAEEFCATGFIPKTETTVIDGMTYYTVKEGQYVAQIVETGVKYETLAKAITAATAEQTVQMIADVTLTKATAIKNKSITLDLNGRTISSDAAAGTLMLYYTSGSGNIEITDSKTGGTVKNTGAGSAVTTYYKYTQLMQYYFSGNITLSGGSYIAAEKTVNIQPKPSSTAKISLKITGEGVSITATSKDDDSGSALFAVNNQNISVEIEGGEFVGNSAISVANATIKGGTFTSGSGSNTVWGDSVIEGGIFTTESDGYCLYQPQGDNTYGHLTISGGTFENKATGATSTGLYVTGLVDLTITGGTFKGLHCGAQLGTTGTIAIRGGVFIATGDEKTDEAYRYRPTPSSNPVTGTPDFISGGYFSTSVAQENCVFGYESIDAEAGAPAAFKVAHKDGYIVKKDDGEGYAVIPEVDSDWIKDNVSQDGVATTAEIEAALNTKDNDTKLKKWQAYVLNQTTPIKVTEIDVTDALKTTLGNAKTGTGLGVSYSLVKVNSATGAETDGTASASKTFTLEKANGSLETGLYKVRVHFKPTGNTSASEVTVDSENTVGVLKVEPNKVVPNAKFVVLAVPFKELGGNATDPVKVSSYIRSGLADGDVLHVYNGDNYDTWTYNGSSWDKATNVTKTDENTESISEPAPATTATLARGTAVILRRAEGNTDPLVFVGDYTGAAEQDIAKGWNLVASPSIEDFDPATKFDSGKIQIPTGGIPLNYTYSPRTKEWGYTTTIDNKPTRVEASKAPIPAGTGFWYISDKATTVTW